MCFFDWQVRTGRNVPLLDSNFLGSISGRSGLTDCLVFPILARRCDILSAGLVAGHGDALQAAHASAGLASLASRFQGCSFCHRGMCMRPVVYLALPI